MGDRIAIMDAGRVLQVGEYRELYDRPANTFVAGFLGTPAMNLFDGVIEGSGVRALNGSLSLTPSQQNSVTPTQQVTVGIRPEHVQPSPTPTWITATIELVERIPSERSQLCYFDVNGQRLVMRAPQEPVLEAGQTLHLHAGPEQVTLFNKTTSRLISPW